MSVAWIALAFALLAFAFTMLCVLACLLIFRKLRPAVEALAPLLGLAPPPE